MVAPHTMFVEAALAAAAQLAPAAAVALLDQAYLDFQRIAGGRDAKGRPTPARAAAWRRLYAAIGTARAADPQTAINALALADANDAEAAFIERHPHLDLTGLRARDLRYQAHALRAQFAQQVAA